MSTIEATCTCQSIGADPASIRFCVECHRYWRGDKKLDSVSSVIRQCWPIKPDFSAAKPEVIENARDRGVTVDFLFSSYVNGALDKIPAGTRKDAVELFFKVRRWWDDHKHGETRAQVILADSEIAGTCDVLDDDCIWDLKCTYNIEATYPLQLAAYGALHFATFGRPAKKLGIIHVTERYPEPKIIKLDVAAVLEQWMTFREFYRLVQRVTGKDK